MTKVNISEMIGSLNHSPVKISRSNPHQVPGLLMLFFKIDLIIENSELQAGFLTPNLVTGVYFTSPDEGWAVGGDDSNHRGVLLRLDFLISPDEGTIGTELTIMGTGLGTRKSKALLGTAVLKILEWTDKSIQCQRG